MSMEDTNQGETVVEQTTQDAPQSEAQEVDRTQEQQPSETETEAVKETNAGDEPPKDNAAWAAMRVENKRLKQALNESGVDSEYLQQLRQLDHQAPAPQGFQQISPDTDLDTVAHSINSANQAVYQTRQEIASLKAELREKEDLEAQIAFPELKSDPLFEQLVAEKKLAAAVVGRRRPTIEIAREVKKLLSRRDEQVVAQTTEQAKKTELQRQQALMEAKTVTSSGQSSYDDDELKARARRGDRAAQETLVRDKLLAGLDF